MAKTLVSNIIVAVSGSAASLLAAKYAIIMAKQNKCRLCAVNVIDTDTINRLFAEKIFVEDEAADYERCIKENGGRNLAFVKELAAAKGLKIETELRCGSIFAEISNAATERNADLIILGGWKKGDSRLSSIHHEIILRADCSVLVMKDHETDLKYRRL